MNTQRYDFETSIKNVRSVGRRIAYPAFFLFLGTMTSLVVAAMSGAILTVCALGLRLIGDWLIAAKLVNYSWFILGPFILIWFTSAYGTGRLYINTFSEISDQSRFRASCLLLVPGVLIWLALFALLTFVFTEYPSPDSWMTFFIPLSCLVNIAGQIVAVNIIREQATQPLSASSKIPRSAKKQAELESIISLIGESSSPSDINQLSTSALQICGLKESTIKLSKSQPVDVLLEVLIAHQRHDDADSISKSYAHLVGNAVVTGQTFVEDS